MTNSGNRALTVIDNLTRNKKSKYSKYYPPPPPPPLSWCKCVNLLNFNVKSEILLEINITKYPFGELLKLLYFSN